MTARHPARTPAQRRVLDAIGCGEHSPMMRDATRDAMLREGLIVELAPMVLRGGVGVRVRVRQFEMPISVHMRWCEAMSAERGEDKQ